MISRVDFLHRLNAFKDVAIHRRLIISDSMSCAADLNGDIAFKIKFVWKNKKVIYHLEHVPVFKAQTSQRLVSTMSNVGGDEFRSIC